MSIALDKRFTIIIFPSRFHLHPDCLEEKTYLAPVHGEHDGVSCIRTAFINYDRLIKGLQFIFCIVTVQINFSIVATL